MKHLLKSIAIVFLSFAAVSCDYDETEYQSLLNDYDPNSEFYVQFSNASRSLRSEVDENGDIVDIETTVDVVILGPPQDQDVVVELEVDPSSTIDPSMYELSSTTVTIPAGETSGSVTLTTNTAEMPFEEPLNLVLNLKGGELNATAGTQLSYELFRIKFCPLENGAVDLAGSYSVVEDYSGYETSFTAEESNGDLLVSGLGEKFITDFWWEEVIAGGTFTMEITGNGNIIIPRQYIFTTEYDGAPYDYEIEGSGTWNNCNGTPVLTFTYDIYYPGDVDGLAKTYSSYLPNPFLGGAFSLD